MINNITIKKSEFIKSVVNTKDLPQDEIGHICVLGRSNVGKSSFINKLCSNYKLARVSKEPGRTRMLNLFLINDGAFYLEDFPGYGYQKGGKTFNAMWGSLIEEYFATCQKIRQVLVLVDIRHAPSQNDIDMVHYLYVNQIPFCVLASKSDKVPKTKITANINMLASHLKIGKDNIMPFSSQNGHNIDTITQFIFQKVNGELNT